MLFLGLLALGCFVGYGFSAMPRCYKFVIIIFIETLIIFITLMDSAV